MNCDINHDDYFRKHISKAKLLELNNLLIFNFEVLCPCCNKKTNNRKILLDSHEKLPIS